MLLNNDKQSKTKQVALGGIMSALAIVFLSLTIILPTLKLTMLVLASICVGIVIVECGLKFSILVYIVISILAFLLVPLKQMPILFGMFFGIYPLFKLVFEKINNKLAVYLLKFAWFNLFASIFCFVVFMFVKSFANEILLSFQNILDKINSIVIIDDNIASAIVLIVLNIVFFVYDYAFSSIMVYYETKLRYRLRGVKK